MNGIQNLISLGAFILLVTFIIISELHIRKKLKDIDGVISVQRRDQIKKDTEEPDENQR